MKRRVIAEDRGICLKSGPLRSTTSQYTIDFSRLCFLVIRRNLSDIFEHVQNVMTVCETLRLLDRDRQNHADVGFVGGGVSEVVVSSKSCSMRSALITSCSVRSNRNVLGASRKYCDALRTFRLVWDPLRCRRSRLCPSEGIAGRRNVLSMFQNFREIAS